MAGGKLLIRLRTRGVAKPSKRVVASQLLGVKSDVLVGVYDEHVWRTRGSALLAPF